MSAEIKRALLGVLPLLAAALATMAKTAILQADGGGFKKQAETRGGRWAGRILETARAPQRFVIAMELLSAWCFVGLVAELLALIGQNARLGGRLPPLLWLVLLVAGLYPLAFLIPQKLAERRPFSVLSALYGPARLAALLLWPLCRLFELAAEKLPGLLHIRPGPETEEVGQAEILQMVDMGEESGSIETAEREMIENIFDFNDLTAEDIMVHRTDMIIIWEEDTEAEILETIRLSGKSRFPVCREDVDDVIGILSTRNYLLNYRAEDPQPLAELLRPAYFVPETVKTDALFRDMQREKVHMAIVVDEYGGTAGLLTMEDLLEQLVGDIYDEFDGEEVQTIVRLSDTAWRIRGCAELEAVAEALEVEIPENDEYDTLGGLIFSGLTVIPDDGSHPEMTAYGLRIVVEELQDRRVEWARVEKPGPEPSGEQA